MEKLLQLTLIVGMFNDGSTLEATLCHLVTFGVSYESKIPLKSWTKLPWDSAISFSEIHSR